MRWRCLLIRWDSDLIYQIKSWFDLRPKLAGLDLIPKFGVDDLIWLDFCPSMLPEVWQNSWSIWALHIRPFIRRSHRGFRDGSNSLQFNSLQNIGLSIQFTLLQNGANSIHFQFTLAQFNSIHFQFTFMTLFFMTLFFYDIVFLWHCCFLMTLFLWHCFL